MKYVATLIISLFLVSCSENPFGQSSSSSCDHSPNADVGLPITCQVSLGNLSNIALWLDSNEASTVISTSAGVEGISDKSGNGNNLVFMSGARASINQSSANERDSLLFSEQVGVYERLTDFNSAVPGSSNLSIFVVFKVKALMNNNFRMTNNEDFSLELNPSGSFIYDLGSGSGELFAPGSILDDIVKVSITYDALSGNSSFYLNGSRVNQANFLANDNAWSQFSVTASGSTEIMEIIIYSDLKTDILREDIETYLDNKWGF